MRQRKLTAALRALNELRGERDRLEADRMHIVAKLDATRDAMDILNKQIENDAVTATRKKRTPKVKPE